MSNMLTAKEKTSFGVRDLKDYKDQIKVTKPNHTLVLDGTA